MGFDPRGFLRVAHELRHKQDEASLRTAIGRAYYYAYLAALAEASLLGYYPSWTKSSAGVHRKLWLWLVQSQRQELAELGERGVMLQYRRTTADYKNPPAVDWRDELESQLREARDFEVLLARIQHVPPPPPF